MTIADIKAAPVKLRNNAMKAMVRSLPLEQKYKYKKCQSDCERHMWVEEHMLDPAKVRCKGIEASNSFLKTRRKYLLEGIAVAIKRVRIALEMLGWRPRLEPRSYFRRYYFELRDGRSRPALVELLLQVIEEEKQTEKQRSVQEDADAEIQRQAEYGARLRQEAEERASNEIAQRNDKRRRQRRRENL